MGSNMEQLQELKAKLKNKGKKPLPEAEGDNGGKPFPARPPFPSKKKNPAAEDDMPTNPFGSGRQFKRSK